MVYRRVLSALYLTAESKLGRRGVMHTDVAESNDAIMCLHLVSLVVTACKANLRPCLHGHTRLAHLLPKTASISQKQLQHKMSGKSDPWKEKNSKISVEKVDQISSLKWRSRHCARMSWITTVVICRWHSSESLTLVSCHQMIYFKIMHYIGICSRFLDHKQATDRHYETGKRIKGNRIHAQIVARKFNKEKSLH